MQDIQDFPQEFSDFRVTDLRKVVIGGHSLTV